MTSTESPLRFSCHTLDKATKAKVTLENYYSNLISQHRERRERLRRLEESLQVTGYSYSISSASTGRGGRLRRLEE